MGKYTVQTCIDYRHDYHKEPFEPFSVILKYHADNGHRSGLYDPLDQRAGKIFARLKYTYGKQDQYDNKNDSAQRHNQGSQLVSLNLVLMKSLIRCKYIPESFPYAFFSAICLRHALLLYSQNIRKTCYIEDLHDRIVDIYDFHPFLRAHLFVCGKKYPETR